ncbi:MAG TPA: lysophospholipid acyltransferase family protein [Sphingomonadaceae bacterium]|nr:lysophospholipid acyltransferase family protein [Sphingomonadaceae bacterium]
MARPSLFARLAKSVLVLLFRLSGWEVVGGPPEVRRCVIIGAPHTSNWDFVRFMGVTEVLGVQPAFIGKHTLFRGAVGRFMREMGGIPVDRSSPADAVRQVTREFARRDDFMLVMSPEGTRGHVGRWKTGFYRIALAAGVPIIPGFLDHANKRLGLGPAMMPSGDYEADMRHLVAFYSRYFPITLEQVLGGDTP